MGLTQILSFKTTLGFSHLHHIGCGGLRLLKSAEEIRRQYNLHLASNGMAVTTAVPTVHVGLNIQGMKSRVRYIPLVLYRFIKL